MKLPSCTLTTFLGLAIGLSGLAPREAVAFDCILIVRELIFPKLKRERLRVSFREEIGKSEKDPKKLLSLVNEILANKNSLDNTELSEIVTGHKGAISPRESIEYLEYYAERLKAGKKIAPWRDEGLGAAINAAPTELAKLHAIKDHLETYGLSRSSFDVVGHRGLLPYEVPLHSSAPREGFMTQATADYVASKLTLKIEAEVFEQEFNAKHRGLMASAGLADGWKGVQPEMGKTYTDLSPPEHKPAGEVAAIPFAAVQRMAMNTGMTWDLHKFASRIEYLHGGSENSERTRLHFTFSPEALPSAGRGEPNSMAQTLNEWQKNNRKAPYASFNVPIPVGKGGYMLIKEPQFGASVGSDTGVWYFLDEASARDFAMSRTYMTWGVPRRR